MRNSHSSRNVSGLLLTRGRFNYERDLRAALSHPIGQRLHVQYGHAWIEDPERFRALDDKDVLYCLFLDSTQEIVPLRHARVRRIDDLRFGKPLSSDDPLTRGGLFRVELELGGYPVDSQGDSLVWPAGVERLEDASSGPNLGLMLDINPIGLPTSFVVPLEWPRRIDVRLDPAPWAAIVQRLKASPHHRHAAFLTVTSVKQAEFERSRWARLRESEFLQRWLELPMRSVRWRLANRLALRATLKKGRVVLRSGRTYRVRLMYFVHEEHARVARYGILNRDEVIRPVASSYQVLTGEYEILDLPFTVRVTRRRQASILLGDASSETSSLGGDQAVGLPNVTIPVDIRPRLGFGLGSGVVAVLSLLCIAVGGLLIARKERSIWGLDADDVEVLGDVALFLGTALFAALAAYFLRPED